MKLMYKIYFFFICLIFIVYLGGCKHSAQEDLVNAESPNIDEGVRMFISTLPMENLFGLSVM